MKLILMSLMTMLVLASPVQATTQGQEGVKEKDLAIEREQTRLLELSAERAKSNIMDANNITRKGIDLNKPVKFVDEQEWVSSSASLTRYRMKKNMTHAQLLNERDVYYTRAYNKNIRQYKSIKDGVTIANTKTMDMKKKQEALGKSISANQQRIGNEIDAVNQILLNRRDSRHSAKKAKNAIKAFERAADEAWRASLDNSSYSKEKVNKHVIKLAKTWPDYAYNIANHVANPSQRTTMWGRRVGALSSSIKTMQKIKNYYTDTLKRPASDTYVMVLTSMHSEATPLLRALKDTEGKEVKQKNDRVLTDFLTRKKVIN